MEIFGGLLFIVALFLTIVVPILAILAFMKSRRLERQLLSLQRVVQQIRSPHLASEEASPAAAAAPEDSEAHAAPVTTGPAVRGEAEEEEEEEEESVPPAFRPPTHEEMPGEAAASEISPEAAEPKTAKSTAVLEEKLASRWMVWLGGIALALGGAFLVKYAIDIGLITPALRTALGFLLGVALAVFGEWLRLRPLEKAIAAVQPGYVPPSLTGAGVAIAFASVFAAHGLYDLISPTIAFVLMAGIALAAVSLSLLQGPLVALLGIVGAIAVPFLVKAPQPNAWVLFPYLTVIVAAGMSVARYRAWWLLAWLILAGASGWTLIWFTYSWSSDDIEAIALYLPVLAGLFFLACRGYPLEPLLESWKTTTRANPFSADVVALGAALAVAVLSYLFVHSANYDYVALGSVFAVCALYLGAGRWRASLDGLSVIALLLTFAAAASWRFAPEITELRPWVVFNGIPSFTGLEPLLAPELIPFAVTSLLFAALFAIGGFVALWNAPRPGLWATVSAFTPIGILIIAYWRMQRFETNFSWSVVAFATAVLVFGAAAYVGRFRSARSLDSALAAYVIAVLAAISLAMTMALEDAWLTVALCIQIPIIAWVDEKLNVKALRSAALVVAAVVLARLVLNYNIFDYPMGQLPGLNWLLYGYGGPAAAFYLAARIFRRRRDDLLVQVLETGALVFGVLLITLEIRHFVGDGSLGYHKYSLLEQSLQSIAWMVIANGLLVVDRLHRRFATYWGWRVLIGLAASQVIVVQTLLGNPLITGEPVGQWPVFNTMLLAYGAPVLLAFWFARTAMRVGMPKMAMAAGVGALYLIFVELNLEVRHAFHGTVLTGIGPTTDAEWYTYSAAWLVYGAILLVLGTWREYAALRYASLVLVWLAVGKVFMFDMRAMTGLYRAFSFLGLGACLIAVGYFYQRFVFKRPLLQANE